MSTQEKSERRSEGAITVGRGVAAAFAAVLVATTTLAAVALVRLASNDGTVAKEASGPALPATVAAPTISTQQDDGDELQVALSVSGFSPAEVSHAAGAFALAVETQSADSEYVLQLKTEGGTLLNEVPVQKGSAVWTVDLPAGRYTLTEASHPNWVCQITTQ
jgi:hypothetical protein